MKLYRVKVSKVIYVIAESAEDAELDAGRFSDDDCQEPEVVVDEATEKSIKRDGWAGAYVHGSETPDVTAIDALKKFNA